MMGRYGAAVVTGILAGWVAPGLLSLPVGIVAGVGAYSAVRAVTPDE